jgi:hypothetical protein
VNGSGENTVEVNANSQFDDESDNDSQPFTAVDAGIDVDKEPHPVKILSGTVLTVSATVTNTGSITLENVLADDDMAGLLDCGQEPVTLEPGEIVVCTGEFTPTEDGTNKVTATADSQANGQIDMDSEDYRVIDPGLTAEKVCAVTGENDDEITWTYTVQNTGNVVLAVTVDEVDPAATIFDDDLGPGAFANIPDRVDSALEPGEYSNTINVLGIHQFGEIPLDSTAMCEISGEFRGCTPGFWKGNERARDACQWTEPTNTVLGSVFVDVSSSDLDDDGNTDTLLDALKFKGGNCARDGTERSLLRMAVAAKLNIEHLDVDYPIDFGELVTSVNDAVNPENEDRCEEMRTLQGELGEFNEGPDGFEDEFEESFCPLSNSREANQCTD